MRIIDNNTLRTEAENKQNNIPTPAELQAKLAKQGMKTAVLGNYLGDEVEGRVVSPSAEVRLWAEKNAVATPTEKDEDVYESDLDNTIPDNSEVSAEIDEVPEDLKDELGEPDDKE